jgi:hypothetical protein
MSRAKATMHPVTVRATNGSDGAVQFHADSPLWDHSSQHFAFHKDQHGMRKQDYHLVEFVLDDETGKQLRFPSSPHDAMWVAKVEDPAHPVCPDESTASDYKVIEPMCVCDDGTRLIVRNDNPREEHYSFTLNLVERGSDQRVSWDPIIRNGNGGSGAD